MHRLVAAAASLVTAIACAEPYYAFRPVDQVTTEVAGRPASRYAIPPEAPRGTLAITTFGLVDMTMQQGEEPVSMVGIRFVIANDNDTAAWLLDTRVQQLEIAGQPASRAAFVNTDAVGSPNIEIPPGQKRVMDFYYPLPDALQEADAIPSYDLVWSVATPARTVAGRTTFERFEFEPVTRPPPPPPVVIWGPYWWYDPWWPRHHIHVIVHPVARPYRIHPHAVPFPHYPPSPRRIYVPARPRRTR